MDFFSSCTDEAQVKSTFRRLSKHFHPDVGGENDLMIELKRQYDSWKPKQYTTFEDLARSPDGYVRYGQPFTNPRVEVLEQELRRLQSLLKNSPDIIERLRHQVAYFKNLLEEAWKESSDKQKILAKEIFSLITERNQLKKRLEELEKISITKEETPDTLWDKIKYVMGSKPKKSYK